MESPSIYIVAEQRKGLIAQETYELFTFTRHIGKEKSPVFLLAGKTPRTLQRKSRKRPVVTLSR